MTDEKTVVAGADAPAAETKDKYAAIIDLNAVAGSEEPAAGGQEAVKSKDTEAKADDFHEEHAEGSEDDEGEDPPRKKRSGISRLKSQIAEAKAALIAAGEDPDDPGLGRRLKSQLAAAQAEIEALRRIAPKRDDATVLQGLVEQEIGQPPKEADFTDYMEYSFQRNAYESDKRAVARELKYRAVQAAQHQQLATEAIFEGLRERTEKARANIKDFDTVLGAATISPQNPEVIMAIAASEKGPQLAYYLSKNPNAVRELDAMPVRAMEREIGKLEASLSLATPKTVTKAPAPVEPLKGGSAPKTKSPADMSPGEYIAYMNAKEKRARQG